MTYIEATAVGQGYYRVFVDGVQTSQHIAEREALEAAGKRKRDNPEATVHYDHDYHVRVDLVDKPIVVPPPQPEPEPEPPVVEPPTPEPEPEPPINYPPVPTGRITASRFRLLGGWRIPQPFCKPGMAIDFATMKAYIGSHAQQNHIDVFDLPAMGQGDDVALWPRVATTGRIERFWDAGNARGLMFRDGKLWASTKVFYDMAPQTIVLHGMDFETNEVSMLPTPLGKPGFGGGFIKGHPSQWMIGCGGYESGQGSVAGPTAALVDGTVLLNQANHGTMVFENRELRPANYSVANDSWVGLVPRDGVGRWACDRVYAGGVWRPDGLIFWPIMGLGEISYSQQNETFSGSNQQSMLYTYDSQSYDQVAFENWEHGAVIGQEVDSDGRVYLLTRNAWRSQMYNVDPVIKVFEVI